jgi:hypothetical protein
LRDGECGVQDSFRCVGIAADPPHVFALLPVVEVGQALAKRFGSSHTALTPTVHAELVTRRPPHRKLLTVVAAVVLSMPVTGMSAAIARDAPVSPPVIEAAVIPETPRVQRMRRYSAVRSIRSLLARRLRDARMRRASRESRAGPGVSRKTWQARGPPSAKDILSAM